MKRAILLFVPAFFSALTSLVPFVFLFPGFLVPWFLGSLVPWFLGSLVPWFRDYSLDEDMVWKTF